MSQINRSPIVRALTEATAAVLGIGMHERADNVSRLTTLQIVLNAAAAELAEGTKARQAIGELRSRVFEMLYAAEIHDRHVRGELTDDQWRAALEANRLPQKIDMAVADFAMQVAKSAL